MKPMKLTDSASTTYEVWCEDNLGSGDYFLRGVYNDSDGAIELSERFHKAGKQAKIMKISRTTYADYEI